MSSNPAALKLLSLSQFDGFKSIEEESWEKRLERRRSVSPVCLSFDSKNKDPVEKPRPKKKNYRSIKKLKKLKTPTKVQKKNATNRTIRNIQYFALPNELSKHKEASYFPVRVPNALCSNQTKAVKHVHVPESIRSREKSHSRSLINIYARQQFRDDPSLRARSRRRISDAARKSRTRYLLDNKPRNDLSLLDRSNRPSSVYRFRPKGFDWTTKRR